MIPSPFASPLRKLSPFLHDGVICVGGCLNVLEDVSMMIQFRAKHPVILRSKHPVTDLIVRDYHAKEGRKWSLTGIEITS